MKINQEFWELIKQGKKTIEFRKVSKLNKYISFPFPYNGRFKIWLEDEENLGTKNHYLGTITINGYSIIKNPFKVKLDEEDYCSEFHKLLQDNLTNIQQKNNGKWLFNYWDLLVDYFKNEEEILILNIESWSDNNEM